MLRILMLASFVSMANIALNYLASKAALESEYWTGMFRTGSFAIAFMVGIASLGGMASLYFVGRDSSFGMANGILLMGAVSIIGGTLVGVFVRGNALHWTEWILMSSIVALIGIRYLIGIGYGK